MDKSDRDTDTEGMDGLTADEERKCDEAFSAFDKDNSGFIDAQELRIVLEMMGQKTTDEEIYRMIAEASPDNTGQISKDQFKKVIAEQKKFQGASNEEDTLDAFVALGGEENRDGYIDARRLIQIIKHEFQMTIDIEKLISDIDEDGSGKIEYEESLRIVKAFSEAQGRNPRILVAKMGQDGHDRGQKVVATALADLGFDVVAGPLFQTPEEAAKDAIASGAHIVGVSSLAAGHLTLVPELRDALAAEGRDDMMVIVGGVIPPQDFDALRDAGAKAIFPPGTVIPDAAAELITTLTQHLGHNEAA